MKRPNVSLGHENDGGLLFYGDPHGEWGPLKTAVAQARPRAVLILGDCQLAQPIHRELEDLFRAGVDVHYVHGNHDKDTSAACDHLVGDHPGGSLHARVADVGAIRIAGLGGIFKRRIWLPPDVPAFASRADVIRSLPRQERWRGSVPLHQRDAIFPEDFLALRRFQADILICHEAPSTHPAGFPAIDDLARSIKVRLVVHGHHHLSYRATMAGRIHVVGLAKAEVYRIAAGDLP